MKQLFSLTALGLGLVLALGTAQAQTVASAPSNAFITAPTPGLTPEPAAAPSAAAAPTPTAPVLPPAAAAAVAAESAAPVPPVANAPAPRSSYRAGRSRGKVAQARPIKVCSVQVNAKKGEDRTASLSACLKE